MSKELKNWKSAQNTLIATFITTGIGLLIKAIMKQPDVPQEDPIEPIIETKNYIWAKKNNK